MGYRGSGLLWKTLRSSNWVEVEFELNGLTTGSPVVYRR
jgi:hypothetical protein